MSEIKQESLKNLYKAMCNALDDGDSFAWIINKCGRQSSLASIERKSIGIQSMSLNTFKIHADEYIDGGFDTFNNLRKAINQKYKNKKPTQTQKFKESSKTYKEKLDEAERLRAILIRAYNDLNKICLDAVKKTPEYQYDLERHNELYGRYFSLTLVSNDE